MSLNDYDRIVSFAIFPALNVARVGNSDEYYVGSEIPGVYVGKGDESFSFKKDGKVKPQAARFRIYGYDKDGKPVREIKLTDGDPKIEITWTVELANRKAAHTQFSGILKYKESNPKRNAGVLITQYANNDYWYDDTSDGSVDATVVINGKTLKNKAVCRASWVNEMAFRGHGLYKQGDFLNPELEKQLKNPGNNDKDLRKNILSRVRIPKYLASPAEFNGQAYDYFMPPLSGNDGDTTPTVPDTYLTVTRGQYILLQRWADGDFEPGNEPTQYHYKFDKMDYNYPQYSKDGSSFESFEAIVSDVQNQIKCLNKAALQWCVGGAFYPGIEMTFVAYDKNTFDERYDFRINEKNISPGDLNAFMALPWQADFFECNTHWWPAQRPDIVIPEGQKPEVEKYGVNLGNFKDWTRGFRTDEPQRDSDFKKAFFEIEREEIFKLDTESLVDNATIDDLHEMLKIAMTIELTTIPAYLYAMYSIKPGTETGDEVIRQIRRVAAEEMLHLSLVANLIAAIEDINADSIGDLYKSIENMFRKLDNQIKYDKLFQLGPGMGYAPSTSDKNEGLIIVDCLRSAIKAIELIISGCNTKSLEATINVKISGKIEVGKKVNIRGTIKATLTSKTRGQITVQDKKNGSIKGTMYVKSYANHCIIGDRLYGKINGEINGIITNGTVEGTVEEIVKTIDGIKKESKGINGTITGGVYDESHYARFNYCLNEVESASDSATESYADPNVVTTLIAFNAAYSYLMLLLQVVWRTDGQKKKTLIMGGMPALMHGVLKPIATFLASASFGFYQFENTSSPKDQLKKAIDAAAKAFSYSDELNNAVTAVDALPDVSQEIFIT
ncbi:2077_t:CDS:10, partial [Racocetra fulgida]